MIHHVNIAWLHQVAKNRKPGYLEACMKLGQISGDFLLLTDADYLAIRREFAFQNPNLNRNSNLPSKLFTGAKLDSRLGLGDIIHAVAGPIGRAIKWPCNKGDGTIDLRPESPCAKLRDRLNRII